MDKTQVSAMEHLKLKDDIRFMSDALEHKQQEIKTLEIKLEAYREILSEVVSLSVQKKDCTNG